MEFPSLPTDSLYKFLGIAGVVLMLAAAVLPRQYADSYRQKARALQLGAAKLAIEVEHLKTEGAGETQRTGQLHRSTKALLDSLPSLSPRTKRGRDEAANRTKLIKRLQDQCNTLDDKLDADTYQASLKLAELEGVIRESKDLEGDATEAIKESRNMLDLGGFLALFGFICWYWYVQRYQDEILKRQALALHDTKPPSQPSRRRHTRGRLPES